jgi:hypothetical protein
MMFGVDILVEGKSVVKAGWGFKGFALDKLDSSERRLYHVVGS